MASFTGLYVYTEQDASGNTKPLSDKPALYVKKWKNTDVTTSIPNPFLIGGLEYKLVTDLQQVVDYIFQLSQNDFKTDRDCIWTLVMEAGSGNEEAGVNTLSAQLKKDVTRYNIGTPQQIVDAEPDDDIRAMNSDYYNSKMRNVRKNRLTHISGDVWATCKNINIIVAQFPISAVDLMEGTVTIPADITTYIQKGVRHYFDDGTNAVIVGFLLDAGQTTISYDNLSAGVTAGTFAKMSYNMPTMIRNFLRINTINPEFSMVEEIGDLRFSYEYDGLMNLSGDGVTGILDFFQEASYTRFQPYDAINNKYGGLKTHPYFADKVPEGYIDIIEFANHLADEFIWGALDYQK